MLGSIISRQSPRQFSHVSHVTSRYHSFSLSRSISIDQYSRHQSPADQIHTLVTRQFSLSRHQSILLSSPFHTINLDINRLYCTLSRHQSVSSPVHINLVLSPVNQSREILASKSLSSNNIYCLVTRPPTVCHSLPPKVNRNKLLVCGSGRKEIINNNTVVISDRESLVRIILLLILNVCGW